MLYFVYSILQYGDVITIEVLEDMNCALIEYGSKTSAVGILLVII